MQVEFYRFWIPAGSKPRLTSWYMTKDQAPEDATPEPSSRVIRDASWDGKGDNAAFMRAFNVWMESPAGKIADGEALYRTYIETAVKNS